jgi:DNA-binding MurR/RpiR family transcriptional regulator
VRAQIELNTARLLKVIENGDVVMAGETLMDIARSYNVSHSTISRLSY